MQDYFDIDIYCNPSCFFNVILWVILLVMSLRQGGVTVGPLSVGFKLHSEALVFGGKTMTSTDIAVASGFCDIGDKERVKHIPEEVRIGAIVEIKRKIEAAIDRVKVIYVCICQW